MLPGKAAAPYSNAAHEVGLNFISPKRKELGRSASGVLARGHSMPPADSVLILFTT
jgi:hypothetical protein